MSAKPPSPKGLRIDANEYVTLWYLKPRAKRWHPNNSFTSREHAEPSRERLAEKYPHVRWEIFPFDVDPNTQPVLEEM